MSYLLRVQQYPVNTTYNIMNTQYMSTHNKKITNLYIGKVRYNFDFFLSYFDIFKLKREGPKDTQWKNC